MPNQAVISLVTTIMGSGWWQGLNQASLNGGTMLWINGQGILLIFKLN